jgi:hypothetical protein
VSAFGPPVNLAVAEPASLAARRCRFVKNAKADSLIAFDAFGKFSREEMHELLRHMARETDPS